MAKKPQTNRAPAKSKSLALGGVVSNPVTSRSIDNPRRMQAYIGALNSARERITWQLGNSSTPEDLFDGSLKAVLQACRAFAAVALYDDRILEIESLKSTSIERDDDGADLPDKGALIVWTKIICPRVRTQVGPWAWQHTSDAGRYDYPDEKRDSDGRILTKDGVPLRIELKRDAQGELAVEFSGLVATTRDDLSLEQDLSFEAKKVFDWRDVIDALIVGAEHLDVKQPKPELLPNYTAVIHAYGTPIPEEFGTLVASEQRWYGPVIGTQKLIGATLRRDWNKVSDVTLNAWFIAGTSKSKPNIFARRDDQGTIEAYYRSEKAFDIAKQRAGAFESRKIDKVK